ncbi:MAG TPA: GDP-mannose 4,6-dehydratase [Nitrososphaerales archaeon]|nr:GDP-mannose 4,6-dehydratase [Nitrososphaerales archaeon]
MKIVVTGGAGFLGSHLVDKLIREGEEIIVIDNLFRGQTENIEQHIPNKKFTLLNDEIQNKTKINDALHLADAVIHFASISSVFRSIVEPEIVNTINVTGTLNMLNLCIKEEVQCFIFASSAAVYGGDRNRPLQENDSLHPLSPFAASKIAGEAYCKAYSETYGLNTIILRFMNIYGPRITKVYRRVCSKFAEATIRNEPLVIAGDGKQTRDFTYVTDAINAILLALNKKDIKGETFNIGTGKPTTINQLANLYKKISVNSKQEIKHINAKKGDLIYSYADITKAKKKIGYNPKIDVETGIPKYFEWYKKQ